MKLNLIPQTASKGAALKTAWFFFAVMLLASIVLLTIMITGSQKRLADAVAQVNGASQGAADAVATSAQADTTIAQAADPIRDANLAKALIAHNDVYPQLYDDLLPYIPSFFRLTSMSASPVDATSSTVTLTGTLQSYQQYADLMLALMRFKDATGVSRTGYNFDPEMVPPISEENPTAIPHKSSEPLIPTNQLERLAYYQSRARNTGYEGAGNFGDGQVDTKGAMPGESLITVQVNVKRNLQVPDAQQTLLAAGPATAASSSAGAAPAGMAGGMPPGMPPGASGPAMGGGVGSPGGPPTGIGGRRGGVNGND